MDQIYQLDSAQLSHPGKKRKNNEDFVAHFEPNNSEDLSDSGCLYLLADGVGGEALGERASRYAVQKVLYEYFRLDMEPSERLRQAMQQANRDIYRYAEQNDRPIRIATTLVAAAIRSNTLTIANVGDSRAYLIRNGRAQQVTQDHNLVGEMVRDGTLTEEEALHSRVKNHLTRSLGGEPEVHVDVFTNIPLQPGDKIMLCSDGLTRYTLSTDIVRLTLQGSPEEITARLIDYANQHGGADNISVVCISIGQPVSIAEAVHRGVSVLHPAAVDWDTVVTQVFDEPKRRRMKPITPRKYQSVIAVGVMVSFVVLGIIVLDRINLQRGINWLLSGSLPTLATLSPPVENTPLPTFTPLSRVTEMATEIHTLAITEIISPTPEEILSPMPVEIGFCRYTIHKGDYLDKLAREWGLPTFDYQAIKCADVDDNLPSCSYTPNTRDHISPGWILDLPAIPRSVCLEHGGSFIP